MSESRLKRWQKLSWLPSIRKTTKGLHQTFDNNETPVSIKVLVNGNCINPPGSKREQNSWVRNNPDFTKVSFAHLVLANALHLLGTGKDLFQYDQIRTSEGAIIGYGIENGIDFASNPHNLYNPKMAVNWPKSTPLDLELYDHISLQLKLWGGKQRKPAAVI